MLSDESRMRIFTGNANPDLAREIAENLGTTVGDAVINRFNNGEVQVMINESVRGKDIFIVQPTCGPIVNDNVMELLIMADAFKRASASHITAVIPYYGYARQDRKARGREPITAKLMADLLECAGITRVVTIDLHAAQIQGFFNVPFDHMPGQPILAEYIKSKNLEDLIVVSPDLGGVSRARTMAERLGCGMAIIDKRRPEPGVAEVMNLIGNVEGKTAILVDDMIDTAGSLVEAAKAVQKIWRKRNLRMLHASDFDGPGCKPHCSVGYYGSCCYQHHSAAAVQKAPPKLKCFPLRRFWQKPFCAFTTTGL